MCVWNKVVQNDQITKFVGNILTLRGCEIDTEQMLQYLYRIIGIIIGKQILIFPISHHYRLSVLVMHRCMRGT